MKLDLESYKALYTQSFNNNILFLTLISTTIYLHHSSQINPYHCLTHKQHAKTRLFVLATGLRRR